MQVQPEKACTKCGILKHLSMFYSDKRATDGKHSGCKDCHNKLTRSYAAAKPESARERTARYRAKNPGAGKAAGKIWRRENRARRSELQARYAKRHPDKIRALGVVSNAKRKASKLMATPAWADHALIKSIYAQAGEITAFSGVAHHVDHIVPLISKLVCGLHVPANLRVLLGSENASKSNRHWPDMP